MGRVMAVDYGDARTGVVFSDLTNSFGGEALVINEYSAARLAARLLELAAARGADVIVLGRPLNMDGSAGERALKSEALAEELRAGGIRTELWDERLTTVSAHRILRQSGKKEKKHRETVDAVAAGLILEGWLRRNAP